jgi:3-methyladenine DNA glycosylase AlkD
MTRADSPTPEAVAKRLLAALREREDTRRAQGVQRYFKNTVVALGVDAPTIRRLVADEVRPVRTVWDARHATALCDLLIQEPHLEAKGAAVLFLERFARGFTAALFPKVRGWLDHHSGSWAVVDGMCSSVLAPLLDRFPELVPEVVDWSHSKNLWLRRASAVAFVKAARRGRELDTAYDVAERLFGDKEDLLHKAVGWLLREAGKTDPKRLETFLLDRGPRIPRTSVRYAIERFPAARRAALLAATRGR